MTDRYIGTILDAPDTTTGRAIDMTSGWSRVCYDAKTTSEESAVRVSTIDRNPLRKQSRQDLGANPKRRLRGFLIATMGEQVRVGFVQQDNSVVEYLLPEKNLRKAGITAINQPFEMDEIEQKVGDGYFTGYVFRPMAQANAVVTDTFDSDDDLTELRNAALRHFGKKTDH